MKDHGKQLKRILLLTVLALLMLLFCGCRTRITNNSEVYSTVNDESGYLYDNYQMRREELGQAVAKEPLFKGNADESAEEEDLDEDLDYDSEDFDTDFEDESDEDYEDEDEDDSGTTTTKPTTTSPTTKPTVVTTRPSTTTSTTTTVSIKVNLKPNGGSCSRTYLYVRKGSAYGTLPTATRSGYDFKGWYTAKKKGKKVKSTTVVTKSSEHTLYAHWKKEKKEKYTITFDANSDGDPAEVSSETITVKEDGTYGTLPTATRDKYTFEGWYTKAEGGTKITKGDSFTVDKDQTLYAHWSFEPYKWWNNEFETAANAQTDKQTCYYYEKNTSGTKLGKLISSCKGTGEKLKVVETATEESSGEEPAEGEEETEDTAEEVSEADGPVILLDNDDIEKYAESARKTFGDSVSIWVISPDSIGGSDNQKLLYKMLLLDKLHSGAFPLDSVYEASTDLEEDDFTEINDYE